MVDLPSEELKTLQYDSNVRFEGVTRGRKIYLWPASCHCQHDRSKGQSNGKIRAADEAYARQNEH